jgi:hypothetical protein
MRTLLLIGNALKAIIFPHRMFREIRSEDRMNYTATIPIMGVWGGVVMKLHYAMVHGEDASLLTVFNISLLSILLWLLGCIAFYFLAIRAGREVKFQTVEIGVFYLWMVGAVSPIFDIPHLFGFKELIYPLPYGYISPHFSTATYYTILVIEVFFFLKYILKLEGMPLLLLPFMVPLFGEFVLIQTPRVLYRVLDLVPYIIHSPARTDTITYTTLILIALSFRQYFTRGTPLRESLPVAGVLCLCVSALFLFDLLFL